MYVFGTAKKFFGDLQEWVWTHKILVVAAGWVIGLATKQMLDTFLEVLVAPISTFLAKNGFVTRLREIVGFQSLETLVFSVIGWLTTIVLTFFVLEVFLGRRVFRVKTAATGEDKVNFAKARALAEDDKILVSDQEAKKIDEKKELEKDVGKEEVALEDALMTGSSLSPLT